MELLALCHGDYVPVLISFLLKGGTQIGSEKKRYVTKEA
jgi:hypothetical protein